MIRGPPRFTLFPYPTLSRSEVHLGQRPPGRAAPLGDAELYHLGPALQQEDRRDVAPPDEPEDGAGSQEARRDRHVDRSEEHTSELQSRQYLVCRLLLEQK